MADERWPPYWTAQPHLGWFCGGHCVGQLNNIQNDCGPFQLWNHTTGASFFSSFLKKKEKEKKKGLCVYSLQSGALAAQMQLCGAVAQGAGPLISREAPLASVGEHPGPAWEEGK